MDPTYIYIWNNRFFGNWRLAHKRLALMCQTRALNTHSHNLLTFDVFCRYKSYTAMVPINHLLHYSIKEYVRVYHKRCLHANLAVCVDWFGTTPPIPPSVECPSSVRRVTVECPSSVHQVTVECPSSVRRVTSGWRRVSIECPSSDLRVTFTPRKLVITT